MRVIKLKKGLWASTIHSDHDGGWYCEIFNSQGAGVGYTEVYLTEAEAVEDAERIAEEVPA